jgi:hypothetical protein
MREDIFSLDPRDRRSQPVRWNTGKRVAQCPSCDSKAMLDVATKPTFASSRPKARLVLSRSINS